MVVLRGMTSARGFGCGPAARRGRMAVSRRKHFPLNCHSVLFMHRGLHQEARLLEIRDVCDQATSIQTNISVMQGQAYFLPYRHLISYRFRLEPVVDINNVTA